jgi:serine/threonine protein kinase
MDRREPAVGGHLLAEEIGRGGMGVVYRARHAATGAERALKILRGAIDADALARFRREAEALARVAGEGVVPIHEIGTERGRLWFAMSLMRGGSLEGRLRERHRFAWPEAAQLVEGLGRALARCHAAGIVHRDLKPANILFDDQDRPHIADFGCARDVTAHSLTETGVVIGSPRYMAPEQLDGQRVDARADIYSLGTIFYELVTGEKPFPADESIVRMLVDRRTKPAPRAGDHVPDLPSHVDAAIAHALAPAAQDRPASVGDWLAELSADSGEKRGTERWRRRRASLVLAGAGAAVAAVALGAALGLSHGEPPPQGKPDDGPAVSSSGRATSPPPVVTNGAPSDARVDEIARRLARGRIDRNDFRSLAATPAQRTRLLDAEASGVKTLVAAHDELHAIEFLDVACEVFPDMPLGPELAPLVPKLPLDVTLESAARLSRWARVDGSLAVKCAMTAFAVCDPMDRPRKVDIARKLVALVAAAEPYATNDDWAIVHGYVLWLRAISGDDDHVLDGIDRVLREAHDERALCSSLTEAIVSYVLSPRPSARPKLLASLDEMLGKPDNKDLMDLRYVHGSALSLMDRSARLDAEDLGKLAVDVECDELNGSRDEPSSNLPWHADELVFGRGRVREAIEGLERFDARRRSRFRCRLYLHDGDAEKALAALPDRPEIAERIKAAAGDRAALRRIADDLLR